MLAYVLKYSDTGGRGVLAPRALPTSHIIAQEAFMRAHFTTTKHDSHVVCTYKSDGVNPQTRKVKELLQDGLISVWKKKRV